MKCTWVFYLLAYRILNTECESLLMSAFRVIISLIKIFMKIKTTFIEYKWLFSICIRY